MSLFKFKTCTEACETLQEPCPNNTCRLWINFEKDLNCTNISIKKNGEMTLRQVAERVGCSFVRVKQIEEESLQKIKDISFNDDYL